MCSVVQTQLHARYNCEKHILEIMFLFRVSKQVKTNVTKPSLKTVSYNQETKKYLGNYVVTTI